jgi:putative transposase
MPESDHLNGCLDEIELGSVEREATPQFLMKLGIYYLALSSLSNTVFIFGMLGVERARFTVHNWVHKADLQPEPDQSSDHVAVDKTAIRLNNETY